MEKMIFRKNLSLLFAFFGIFLCLLIFFSSFFVLYKEVKVFCLRAQSIYKEECVGSLIRYIQSEDNTLRSRNSAIWALGQLADKKALPFLNGLNKTLTEQKKCDYDTSLCKYEVQKAIRWCEQGNITNWMYGNRENWR